MTWFVVGLLGENGDFFKNLMKIMDSSPYFFQKFEDYSP